MPEMQCMLSATSIKLEFFYAKYTVGQGTFEFNFIPLVALLKLCDIIT